MTNTLHARPFGGRPCGCWSDGRIFHQPICLMSFSLSKWKKPYQANPPTPPLHNLQRRIFLKLIHTLSLLTNSFPSYKLFLPSNYRFPMYVSRRCLGPQAQQPAVPLAHPSKGGRLFLKRNTRGECEGSRTLTTEEITMVKCIENHIAIFQCSEKFQLS